MNGDSMYLDHLKVLARSAGLVVRSMWARQQLASGLREGHVSEYVDDQEADLGELGLEAEQSHLVACLDQLVDRAGQSDSDRSSQMEYS